MRIKTKSLIIGLLLVLTIIILTTISFNVCKYFTKILSFRRYNLFISYFSVSLNNYELNDMLRKSVLIKSFRRFDPLLSTIYVITPTYERWVQKAELIRLSHTLLLTKNIHWILVEDSKYKTQLVTKFIKQLESYGHLNVTQLNIVTPPEFKTRPTDPNWLKPRGVLQRNAGIDWLRNNVQLIDKKGVVYFADDDNTYSLKVFDEMRSTRRVSVWPVGLVGGLIVETPIVSDGKVIAWNTMWKKERQYPIDMSGFAVNLQLLLNKPKAYFSLKVSRGYQESFFIQQLIDSIDELEPKANNCSEILVWHTRTQSPNLKQESKLKSPSNTGIEF